MENKPILTISGLGPAPGINRETYDRFVNRCNEVYFPLHAAIPGRLCQDTYNIVKASPEYPPYLILQHSENIHVSIASRVNPERKAVAEELANWIKRHVMVYDWNVR